VILYQGQTKLVKQIGFVLRGVITTYNKRTNHKFRRGVAELVAVQNHRKPSDFISVGDAQQKIFSYTGRSVSHSTAARWVALNELGYKLDGIKGQWIVDSILFDKFMDQIVCH
jgi:hypothetical protein